MSGHHHDDHSMEQKPVAFTVPFLLALVVIIATVMFLSLCDPKPHHGDMEEGHGHGQMHEGHAAAAAHETAPAHHGEASAATEAKDSMTVETTVPDAEPAHH